MSLWNRITQFPLVLKCLQTAGVLLFTTATTASGQPWVTYDASLGTTPTAQCFPEFRSPDAPAATVVDGQLYLSTAGGVNSENTGTYLYWERSDVTVDYGSGFAMEAAVTIVSSDDNSSGDRDWPRLGYMLYAISQNGKWFDMDLASGSIVLRNHPDIGEDGVNCRRMAFPVAGSPHVYRVQIDSNGADLLIDGVIQNLHIPDSTTYAGAPNVLGFGDGTVWANSESYTRHVRFTGVDTTCCPVHNGDMNADGAVDSRDVQRFTDSLMVSSSAFADTCPGDFDNSGVVDRPDLPDFVDTLLAQ
jgi:hypothetical protein